MRVAVRAITIGVAVLLAAVAADAQTPVEKPSATTLAVNARMKADLPFSDRRDFDFARLGFVATRTDPLIKNAAGAVVWDLNQYDFTKAATTRFGSGWAWLIVGADQKLSIASTPNQDTPLMGKAVAGCEGTPLLGIDVWEHAYYLKYQNRRPDYLKAIWNTINWAQVAANYEAALK